MIPEPLAPTESHGARRALTVSALLRLMQTLLEDEIGTVRVEGEIAEFKRATSGHCYFSLKDGKARISCVWFAGAARASRLPEPPADGMQVEIEAEAAIYPARGQLQLIVRRIIPGGQGALLLQFEALKRKLQAEGLFDAARKRPLPLLPLRIGIVTSPTGAAIRDMLKVLGERFPNLYLLLAPVRVQGEGAAAEIAAAIAALNVRGGLDALIVGRGGGSLEDLWAFNEEVVVRAVHASRIPVISAVGHEVDLTLCDLAADVRAPTPSAAAECVIGRKADFERELQRADLALRRALAGRARELRARLEAMRGSRLFREPRYALAHQRQTLDALAARATEHLRMRSERERRRLSEARAVLRRPRGLDTEGHRERLRALEQRLARALHNTHARAVERVGGIERHLRAVSPEQVLARGYSLAQDAQGRVVASVGAVRAGDALTLRLRDGSALTRVESVSPAPSAAPPPRPESSR